MTAFSPQFVRSILRARPRGPILAKDLRVASRRVWLYGLRFAYLAALAGFTALGWASWTRGLGQGTQVSRAAEAGKSVVASIVWFQFVAAQVVTVILLGSAVSGEVRKRTLPALLTTPLGPFQIVLEKLGGGILSILVLLVCGLPLLAVVRVFGGVPWEYVLGGLGVTATACVLAGAIAIYVSVRVNHPLAAGLLAGTLLMSYQVLGWTDIPLVLVAFAVAVSWDVFSRRGGSKRARRLLGALRTFGTILLSSSVVVGMLFLGTSPTRGAHLLLSPGYALFLATDNMMVPGRMTAPGVQLAIHCVLTILIALAILRRAARSLGETARTRIWGLDRPPSAPRMDPAAAARAIQILTAPGPRLVTQSEVNDLVPYVAAAGAEDLRPFRPSSPWTPPIRCDRLGSALLWKDTRRLLLRNDVQRMLFQVLPFSTLVVVYLFSLMAAAYRHILWHEALLTVYVVGGTLMTLVLSAGTISVERQSRTWPILLTTAMGSWHLLAAKAAGVFYRCLPAWAPLLVHTAIFTLTLHLHPAVLLGMVLLVGWIHVLLCGSGFFFSMVLRGMALSVIANFLLGAVLWVVLPAVALQAVDAWGGDLGWGPDSTPARLLGDLRSINPAGQVGRLVEAGPGYFSADRPGPSAGPSPRLEALDTVVRATLGFGSLGAVLLWLAGRRFRRNAFD